MSRLFTKNTSNNLVMPAGFSSEFDGTGSIAVSVFAKAGTLTSTSSGNYLFNFAAQGTGNPACSLRLRLNAGVITLRAEGRAQSSDSGLITTSSIALNAGEWYHFGALFLYGDGGKIRTFVNGVGEDFPETTQWTNATFNGTSGATPSRIGDWSGGTTTTTQFDGQIAHLAGWRDVADWDDQEMQALFFGAEPSSIRPGNLVCHWPLWGEHSPEIELIKGGNATITGSISRGSDDPWVRTGRLWVPVHYVAAQPGVSGDGDLTLPAITCEGEATFAWQADGDLTLPALNAAGSGSHGIRGDGALTLPALTADGSAQFAFVGDGDLTLPQLTTAGSGVVGIKGDGDLTLPAITCRGVQGSPLEAALAQRRRGGFGIGFG